MNYPPLSTPRALPLLGVLVLGLLGPAPARAQATLTAEAGLDGFYKADRWVPVHCTITNQGQPTRLEVRARFQQGQDAGNEYRIPEFSLQGSANIRHTLYLSAPASYAPQSLYVVDYRDGRPNPTPSRPKLNMVGEGDWLIVSVGSDDNASALKLLTTTTMSGASPRARPWMSSPGQHQVSVAVLEPGKIPDRWQGLESADAVVLGDVSERDFTPHQQAALRDYVISGGTLVITGGVNWTRLTTPFFSDLLPVRVTGSTTVTSPSGLRSLMPRPPSSGQRFALCTATPRPGADVRAEAGGTPLVVRGARGSGQVIYVAFDPSRPPFQTSPGVTDFWKRVIVQQTPTPIIPALESAEDWDEYGRYGYNAYGNMQGRLADAPYAISQLDIPAFYIVALFLLAYIIVLVPVNYYVLKARDKKEYAWLTTPAIVLLFSVAAYVIGYGFKGGRTLLARVGVIEAQAGEDSAPALTYAGLFSPRKTAYDIQLNTGDPPGQAAAASTLISEPQVARGASRIRMLFGDVQKVDDLAVDMWAMRVLKTKGLVRLGKGVTARITLRGSQLSGTIRNDSPFTLDDCQLIAGNQPIALGTIPSGGQVPVKGTGQSGSISGTMLPPSLMAQVKGSPEVQRMKRAVLQPICSAIPNTRPSASPILVGWVRGNVAALQVDGRAPREQSATLMVVHLDNI